MARPQHILLVDGYNVLRSGQYAAHLERSQALGADWTDGYFNRARECLYKDVAELAAGRFRPYIVFDAAANPYDGQKEHHTGSLTVLFSDYGQSADSKIEGLSKRFQEQGYPVTVLSADRALQETVMGGQVTRMSVLDFTRELEYVAELDVPEAPSTNKLGDHLDPETRAKLDRLRGRP
ncbi:MAG: NYN domain-containing protein [Coriobacteriales bacterium]|jgi:predicted RNA-binding protein with PIN domain|nr:NYN domain-containing protein [Coriobacteriales bacterium]